MSQTIREIIGGWISRFFTLVDFTKNDLLSNQNWHPTEFVHWIFYLNQLQQNINHIVRCRRRNKAAVRNKRNILLRTQYIYIAFLPAFSLIISSTTWHSKNGILPFIILHTWMSTHDVVSSNYKHSMSCFSSFLHSYAKIKAKSTTRDNSIVSGPTAQRHCAWSLECGNFYEFNGGSLT